jgi:hypothetical protein
MSSLKTRDAATYPLGGLDRVGQAMDQSDVTASVPAPGGGAAARALAPLDRDTANAIVDRAIRRYIADRRAMVDAFIDRHFSLRGSLRLHRHAIGLDMVRAPINVAAGFATAGKRGIAYGLRRAGAERAADWLDDRQLFLRTKVGREIEWLIVTEFLGLPLEQPGRSSTRDALIETVLADPQVQKRLEEMLTALDRRAGDIDFRRRVTEAMVEYVGSRSAAADVTTTLFTAATGMAAYHQFTPGVAALSGSIAGSIAKTAAISNFWAGSWIGGLYYSIFSVPASPLLTAGVFSGLMVPLAVLTAFAGVVADPVQRRLGLHRRRLVKMVDVLERNLLGEGEARFVVRDHYAARLFDVMDWSSALLKLAARS